ncbi:hypothetical protein [Pseudooceanicola sp.]|uniref:hypothetical protein n=1 Tax=Pseudooceanicola sp. TaxID=1914328 RepID=UPI0035C6C6F0
MQSKSAPVCRLQLQKQRRLSVSPNHFGLEQDICDITLWLVEKFKVPSVHLWVDRHYVHEGRQIAGVTAMMFHRTPNRLTPAAYDAFRALGYEIEDTGADIYAHEICDGKHSRHEALKAFGRIQAALRSWPQKT